jgi:thioredoxin reductase (NADPH)
MAGEIRVLGATWCPDCKRTKQFLSDQRIPYQYLDVESDAGAREEVERLNDGKLIIPVVQFPDGQILVEPSNAEVAELLGLEINAKKTYYELIVIGGGPAGLTASIYAAREGIDTLVIDRGALGGQAGVTERVDNYPGFPDGITGAELAERYVEHAKRYGVEMLSGVEITKLERTPTCVEVTTDRGVTYGADAVVIASGSTYRRLGVEGEDELIGAGIHFCATCDGPFYRGAENLVVVGGGNSALEEGLFLTQFAERITLIQNTDKLTASRVLQERVTNDPKFDIRLSTQVRSFVAGPNGKLDRVVVETPGGTEEIVANGVFLFIGLKPNTEAFQNVLELDPAGFLQTGPTMATSMEGVFAAGDVRKGSTKQIASAVGEGAAVLIMVRQYLESLKVMAPKPED